MSRTRNRNEIPTATHLRDLDMNLRSESMRPLQSGQVLLWIK
jgi:hypothetical protein